MKASSKMVGFIGLSYGLAWAAWLPGLLATLGVIGPVPWPPLFALGACGPLAAASWCTYREGGWAQVKSWLRNGFTRRVGWRGWALILTTPFLVPPLALRCYWMMGGTVAELQIANQPWMVVPTILLMVTIGGAQEEYGWRGYLLPELGKRWRPWQVDIFMIGVHVCWHLPLFFIGYTLQSQYSFWIFLVFGAGFTPLINRVYRQTGGSILAVVLFHGLVNAGLDIFPAVGAWVGGSSVPLLLVGVFYGLLAGVVSLLSRQSDGG